MPIRGWPIFHSGRERCMYVKASNACMYALHYFCEADRWNKLEKKKLFISYLFMHAVYCNNCISYYMGLFAVMCGVLGLFLCRIYCSSLLPSFLHYPHNVPMMKLPVTSPRSPLLSPPLACLTLSPLPKQWQEGEGVGKRCFVKYCEKVSCTVCQSQSQECPTPPQPPAPSFPPAHQLGTRYSIMGRKTTWSQRVWAFAERNHGHATVHRRSNHYCSAL